MNIEFRRKTCWFYMIKLNKTLILSGLAQAGVCVTCGSSCTQVTVLIFIEMLISIYLLKCWYLLKCVISLLKCWFLHLKCSDFVRKPPENVRFMCWKCWILCWKCWILQAKTAGHMTAGPTQCSPTSCKARFLLQNLHFIPYCRIFICFWRMLIFDFLKNLVFIMKRAVWPSPADQAGAISIEESCF